jgi:hypothetical protein
MLAFASDTVVVPVQLLLVGRVTARDVVPAVCMGLTAILVRGIGLGVWRTVKADAEQDSHSGECCGKNDTSVDHGLPRPSLLVTGASSV